jgi:hypothetical protein
VQHVALTGAICGRGISREAGAVSKGFDVRFHPLLSLLAASLIVFAPVHAAAQTPPASDASVRDRTRADYDPLGMRLGAFQLNGSVDFGVTYNDNIFAEESGFEDEDVIFSINPNARLESNWSRHSLGFYAGAGYYNNQDFSSEDAETYYLRSVGRLDIGSNSSLTGVLGYAREVEPRTDPDSPLTLEPIEFDRSEAALIAEHRFNRFRIVGEAFRTEYDFRNAQNFRDNETTGLRGRIEAEITPRLGALVEATTDERDYPNSPSLSSEGQSYLVGATVKFTDLMQGELLVGQFERDYNNGALNSEGLAVSANLQWYVTRLTTLTFDANRSTEEQIGGGTSTPYVQSSFGGRVDHELRRNIILSAGATGGRREFSGVDREDDYLIADAGVEYLLNRRVALSARYIREEVESSGAAAFRDFEVNRFSLGLSLRL